MTFLWCFLAYITGFLFVHTVLGRIFRQIDNANRRKYVEELADLIVRKMKEVRDE
jgi:hypothetical protein